MTPLQTFVSVTATVGAGTISHYNEFRNTTINGHAASGYSSGQAAKPLFGIDWSKHWETPLKEMRQRLAVDPKEAGEFGEGILAEAA